MTYYSIEQIENICFSKKKFELSEKTLNILKDIESKVGSPDYIKTPNFNKKKKKYMGEDWDSIRGFKTTKIIETTSQIEEVVIKVKDILNKLTKDTFESNCEKLLELIDNNELNDVNMLRIGKLIFSIGSQNKFYSDVYADLYKVLMYKYEIMIDVFNKSLNDFISIFENIDYVSAEEDYDRFCVINKENEERKSLSSFFISLMNCEMIEEKIIIDIILNLQNKIYAFYENKEKRNHIDEISENLFILITKGYDKIKEHGEISLIKENVEKITNINKKNYLGITNKTIFKNMDILDAINK